MTQAQRKYLIEYAASSADYGLPENDFDEFKSICIEDGMFDEDDDFNDAWICYQDAYSNLKESMMPKRPHLRKTYEALAHQTEDVIYTGLSANGVYEPIISSVAGQIYDGIGEGDSRESKIFRHTYEGLGKVRAGEKNGELVIYISLYGLHNLIRCIWRIAQIERNDKGVSNRNMYYQYLDADWKTICALQAVLNSIASGKKANEPWSAETKAKKDAQLAIAAAKEESERKAKKEAEEAAKKEEESRIASFIEQHQPDAKDLKRAQDAWSRSQDCYKFKKEYYKQYYKIEDFNKLIRRTVAFYNELLGHPDHDEDYDYVKSLFESKIASFMEKEKQA